MADENSVYVIAGGNTLAFINLLKAEADKARKELERIAEAAGGAVDLNPGLAYGEVCPIFNFSSRPEGWKLPSGVPGPLRPDDGKLDNEIDQQAKKMDVQSQFNKACAEGSGIYTYGAVYSFEEIGDKTVVKCIVHSTSDGFESFIPPDSKHIDVSEYTKMKVDAGLISTPKMTIKPFKHPFEI
jgi:hypothetical protein